MQTKANAVGGGRGVFIAVHLIGLIGPFFVGIDWRAVTACFLSYYVRMFFVTGFFHRLFSHRAWSPRGPEWWRKFVVVDIIGFCCMTVCQKSPKWWSPGHRTHHRYTEIPGKDPHTSYGYDSLWKGLWMQHIGWIFDEKNDGYDPSKIRDLDRDYPGLARYDTFWGMIIPPVLFATMIFLVGATMGIGLKMLVWGFFTSTVLLYHGTFAINSLAHHLGTQRYTDTGDDSRNSLLLAIITMGEGWHNNHHKHQHRLAQGETRFEKMFDWTYLILRSAEICGLVTIKR